MKDPGHGTRPFYIFHPSLLVLASAAGLLRLGLSLYFPRAIKEDESAYLLLGHNLVTGNGFTYTGYPELHFPPLHPLLIGLFSFVIRDGTFFRLPPLRRGIYTWSFEAGQ